MVGKLGDQIVERRADRLVKFRVEWLSEGLRVDVLVEIRDQRLLERLVKLCVEQMAA